MFFVSTRVTLFRMKKHPSAPMARLLLNAFRWFDASLLASLGEQGWPKLSHSQSMVMAYVGSEGMRISELARKLGVTRQAAQKSVSELERAGLLWTEVDPTNLSAKTVRLTVRGQNNVSVALAIFAEIEGQLSMRIGQSEMSGLRRVLELDWGEPLTIIKPHQTDETHKDSL